MARGTSLEDQKKGCQERYTSGGCRNRAVEAIRWRDGVLEVLDQRCLPREKIYLRLNTIEDVVEAIREMSVRGAPVIGIAGAYGLLIRIRASRATSFDQLLHEIEEGIELLLGSRPTAVNLRWSLDRMRRCAIRNRNLPLLALKDVLEEEAISIHKDDKERCELIAEYGASLIKDGAVVLTHCNAGALATGGIGTALGMVYRAIDQGKQIRVIATETRPLLQGGRLTCWELIEAGVKVTMICDTAVGRVIQEGMVDLCIVGADRIASNGDVANKIGTYQIAIVARECGIPLYVAAPLSTFDSHIEDGREIPIEVRGEDEVRGVFGREVFPSGVDIYNPAFDITPGDLVSAFITEKGIIYPPYDKNLRGLDEEEAV